MRKILVAIGLVLVILGAVLIFVPIVQASNQTVSESSPYVANLTGISITGTIPGTISWSSNVQVTFIAASCTSVSFSGNLLSPCPGFSIIGNQNGTSGSMTFNVKSGSTLFAGIVSGGSGAQAAVTVTVALTKIGTVLLIVGVIVLLLGVVLKSKAPKAPTAPPRPGATMPDTAPPDHLYSSTTPMPESITDADQRSSQQR